MPKADPHPPPPAPPGNAALQLLQSRSVTQSGASSGCSGMSEGRVAVGRHRRSWQAHPMPWSNDPSTHTHTASPCRVMNVSPAACWLPRVHQAPQGISHLQATTSPPRTQSGHRPLHPSRTQHPRLSLGSVRPQGWSWRRSLPAPEIIQGQDKKHQEGQGSQDAGTDPCCLGREGWGARPRMNPAPPSPALSPPRVTQDQTIQTSRAGDSGWEPGGASAAGSAAREDAASTGQVPDARRTSTCGGQQGSPVLPGHAAPSRGRAETAGAAETDGDSAAESGLSRHPGTGSESRVPRKAEPCDSMTGSHSPTPGAGPGDPVLQRHRLDQQLRKFSAPFCLETSLFSICFTACCAQQQGQAAPGTRGSSQIPRELLPRRRNARSWVWKG